jgi:methylenetetrahydrofolate reductase (NADPH)
MTMPFRRLQLPDSVGEMLGRARHEVLPLRGVEEQFDHLRPGSTVTVTASPKLGIDRTLHYTELLAEHGYRAVPHLAARDIGDDEQLRRIVARLDAAGVRDAFVIGGDLAGGTGTYPSGTELIEAVAELAGDRLHLGIAAYPEGHPVIDDSELLDALLRKQRVAHYMVSQMCFDPAKIVEWLRRVRDRGVELPLYVGIPGAVRRAKLLELSFKLGIGPSIRYLSKQRGLLSSVSRPGRYQPGAIVAGLSRAVNDPALGIAGFQVFTFNQVARTVLWERRASGAR